MKNAAQSAIIMVLNGKIAGLFGIADSIKSSSREAVERLKQLGLELVMLTGDNAKTARVIGDMVGIDRVVAEVLPQDKAEQVKQLQKDGKIVCHGR